jgi:hypothetical protein
MKPIKARLNETYSYTVEDALSLSLCNPTCYELVANSVVDNIDL